MKRILVTGADGFTASHLLPVLREEPAVWIAGTVQVDHPSAGLLDRSLTGDVLDPEFLPRIVEEFRPDEIFHLAAVVPVSEVRREFPRALRVNVEGTWRLLRAVASSAPAARVLVAGSSDEYGLHRREEMPLREDARFSPANEYGVTKVAQELLASRFHREEGIAVLFTRTFNFTGPGQSPEFVCSSFARQVAMCRGRGGGTIEVGNLEVHRDFLDIRDVARAYRRILERGAAGEVYNVFSGEPVSLRWILDRLIAMAGVPIEVARDERRVRKVDIPYLVGDNGKLRSIGWERRYGKEEILSDLFRSWEGVAG